MRSINESDQPHYDVAVVGGGLAGLAAAAFVARAGRSVALFEKSPRTGGRAASTRDAGFTLNLGPHALYRGGAGIAILRELGVEPSGRMPATSGGHIARGGRLHGLPSTPWTLVRASALAVRARLQVARLLAGIGRIDARRFDTVSVREWIERAVRHPDARTFVGRFVNVSTYVADLDRFSAGSALDQLKIGLEHGVLYVDGGWQSLVDGLRDVALRNGAHVARGARVEGVAKGDQYATLRLADGRSLRAGAVILAIAPSETASLVAGAPGETLRRWSSETVPARFAALDLALERLPEATRFFALGFERPLYFSVHSNWADLAPHGAALLHAGMYLRDEGEDPRAIRRELEALVDLMQPGWRDLVVASRFLPAMTVTQGMPTAAAGGTRGRPGPEVPGARGLFVAGDWVGPEGQLADAALASAKLAAARALEMLPAARLTDSAYEELMVS